ncbi:hypothetical protein NNJEOMEG_02893 [Fundidesulfovibrio magnetotacticus]|uniref:Tetratricopeptide repeat protein n=1 Tax=Fundidesulfovibrio magnetotacticus TaxID=2730080 RepID=A0A6V8LVT7_9BACT|nr:tetratricopeptide repeat protein [Fundidesulfovibrio magnetotacticus]GFK95040.1 hypothetical protein NNJEOMEG_02893 [Fundidesulfovibrio magnetotacticus]
MEHAAAKLHGIFSQETAVTLGTGATRRKTVTRTYWFAREVQNGKVEMRSLDVDFQLQGTLLLLDREDVLTGYMPEAQTTYQYLSRPLMQGDAYREVGNHPGAVREYEKVRRIDEANVRAAFGLGISLLALGLTDKAVHVFDNLLELDEAFEDEHKHLFNELGIALRKRGLLDQTLRYYFRAQEMTFLDENLQFNIARAYLEKNDLDNALKHLLNALDINSFFGEGLQFARYILDRGLLNEDDKRRRQLHQTLRAAGYLE